MLVEQGVADARDALRAGQVGPRQEAAQAPPPDLARGPAGRAVGPRARGPMPRRSSLTGSRWPGSRARSGRGRAGRPSSIGRSSTDVGRGAPRRRRGRRGGTTTPAGSATAGSSSSISTPMTGWSPASSAAAEKRTAPYRPSWSVAARPVRPSSTARATRSSGAEAPSRNEKFVCAWSSAYGMRSVLATGRSGRPARSRLGARQYRTNVLSWRTMKHNRGFRRLTAMQAPLHLHRPLRPVAPTALRTALCVALAMLLDPRPPARDPRGAGGGDLAPHDVSAPGGSGRISAASTAMVERRPCRSAGEQRPSGRRTPSHGGHRSVTRMGAGTRPTRDGVLPVRT